MFLFLLGTATVFYHSSIFLGLPTGNAAEFLPNLFSNSYKNMAILINLTKIGRCP